MAAQRYPVRLIDSGPAAGGHHRRAHTAAAHRPRDLIAFDMGGTTAKAALIEKGRPRRPTARGATASNNAPGSGLPDEHARRRSRGDRGGQGLDRAASSLGIIAVGPESAGSDARPGLLRARAAASPTVTDADLVLGYLNADYFLGGAIKLQPGPRRARHRGAGRAAARVGARGRRVGHPPDRDANMEGGDARGVDRAGPGSARPHARRLRRLGSGARGRLARGPRHRRVIVPFAAGVAWPWGCSPPTPRVDVARTLVDGRARRRAVGARSTRLFDEPWKRRRAAQLRETGWAGEWRRRRSADVRYAGQGTSWSVGSCPWAGSGPESLACHRAAHAEVYAGAHGYAERRARRSRRRTGSFEDQLRGAPRRWPPGTALEPRGRSTRKGARRAYLPEAGRIRRVPGLRPLSGSGADARHRRARGRRGARDHGGPAPRGAGHRRSSTGT